MIGVTDPDKPRVCLALPLYSGELHFGAACGYFGAALCQKVDIVSRPSVHSSLLPSSFNGALAHALDLRDQGIVTHFAMIHADVAPRDPDWLDTLYAEMQAHDADLISTVIPIKEPNRQRTSTAIGDLAYPWEPKRFITVDDRDKYPLTFSADDVCGPGEVMLVNTGLWLADLRRPWWDDFGFELRARIQIRDGTRHAQVIPEDWQMSRHLQAAGARVFATWKVPVGHHGTDAWFNTPAKAAS